MSSSLLFPQAEWKTTESRSPRRLRYVARPATRRNARSRRARRCRLILLRAVLFVQEDRGVEHFTISDYFSMPFRFFRAPRSGSYHIISSSPFLSGSSSFEKQNKREIGGPMASSMMFHGDRYRFLCIHILLHKIHILLHKISHEEKLYTNIVDYVIYVVSIQFIIKI